MNTFLFAFYVGLYAFVAGALVTIDVVSIKAGWPWLSQLVKPMGIVFLCVNIPLAFFAVAKIGHVVFLHSLQHHRNVMRSIREADLASPYPNVIVQPQKSEDAPLLSKQSIASGTPFGHVQTSRGVQPGQDKKADSDNVIVARMLIDYPGISIRKLHEKSGIPISSIGVTYAWKNRSR